MSNAVNSKSSNKNQSVDADSDFYGLVAKYRPLIRRLTMSPADAEDLEQEVYIRLLNLSIARPDWLEQVKNKRAYIVAIIKNRFYDLKRRKAISFTSYDDTESSTSIDKVSDGGIWVKELNEEMDFEKVRLLLKEVIESYTDYEQILIQLNFIEGLKPKEIAIRLAMNYAEVNIDCNRIKANLRGKLKKKLLSLK